MKKLLLVMGDLATGKSTFASILSQRYKANVFYKDSIKEVLGDTIGFTNREDNLKLSKATLELMLYHFSETAKIGNNLILESNFHIGDLERLHKIADRHDYDVCTLVLRGDVEILHKRYLHRIYHENRHPVHLTTTLDVFEDFKGYAARSRTEEILGKKLVIDANDFSYQTNPEILNQIDQFLKD